MAEAIQVATWRELGRFTKALQNRNRKTIPDIPPEDLMEQAADLLESTSARVLFMTTAGLPRLLDLVQPMTVEQEKGLHRWLQHRFQILASSEEWAVLSDLISLARLRPNLNITFKRLTNVLSGAQRAVLAEGFLDILATEFGIQPSHQERCEEILTKLFLSSEAAMQLLDNWNRKRQEAKSAPKTLPGESS